MDESPPETHSFVVRIWEKKGGRSEDASWRGSVTHVGTGDRLYLESLRQLPEFLSPYVDEIGGQIDFHSRLCFWVSSTLMPWRSDS